MKLTNEQQDILNTLDNKEKIIKINAYAGTGKTSTIIELVKKIRETDKDCKILYTVFNRSMFQDSKAKFEELGLNVECQTTHGFALKRFNAIKDGLVNVTPALDFNIFSELKNTKQYSKSWIRFKSINDLLNAYCLTYDDLDTFYNNVMKNSSKYGLDDKISFTEIKFFKDIYNYMIQTHTYTHGMYLKCYACECADKITTYDYVLLDECQDTNLMFLNIFKRMKYKKAYMVGDIRQNIYQFTHTVNMFKLFDGSTYPLSTSFRINNETCKLANKILSHHYNDFKGDIKNLSDRTNIDDKKQKTILFRLNSTMFDYAVNLITEVDNIKVKFMDTTSSGNANCFDECFSDMLYFYYKLIESQDKEKAQKFKREFNFKTCKTVDNYVKLCNKEKSSLYRYLWNNKSILPLDFLKYFNFFLLNELDIINVINKVKHSEECENPTKTYTLITAHRSKGLEWEHVKVAPDEWSLKTDAECNLCYVAVTRAMKKLEAEPILSLL